ncbi:MAG: hypothetical protein GTO63_30170 [Anaerolineae bacterium]|nr:hypothetical protein [Anaerolineae bacterium]NIN98971.1 hypothetical protein [Anaerolineae bacterium]
MRQFMTANRASLLFVIAFALVWLAVLARDQIDRAMPLEPVIVLPEPEQVDVVEVNVTRCFQCHSAAFIYEWHY